MSDELSTLIERIDAELMTDTTHPPELRLAVVALREVQMHLNCYCPICALRGWMNVAILEAQ